jgi:hypothetical protein
MDKTKLGKALSGGPIAEKIVAKMKRRMRSKIVNIRKVIESRTTAEELHKTVATQEELAGLDLAHAAYVYTQNHVSVLSEQLTGLKEMGPFADIISRAEDLYMPSAPPISPLTTSYFTCWAFFDACAGRANETIGTTILELGAAFGIPCLSQLENRYGDILHYHRGTFGIFLVLKPELHHPVSESCHTDSISSARGGLRWLKFPGSAIREPPSVGWPEPGCKYKPTWVLPRIRWTLTRAP